MAVRAFLQVALVDMATVVADGVGDVEREVVATFLSGDLQQVQVLLLGEVLVKVHVQGRATGEVLDVGSAMQLELVDDGEGVVLNDIEVGVVAVAWYEVTVLTIPLGMLHTDVLGRNHLAVEHDILGAVLLVVLFDESEDALNKLLIVVVGCNLQSHELGSLYETIDTDGEVLACDVDVACIEQGQHAVSLQVLEVLVVGELYLVAEVDDLTEVLQIVHLVVDGILHATVEVDGEH